MKTFVIEEKFVGYADITIEAETEEEAIALYNRGHYKDSNYIIDDMTYDHEFFEIAVSILFDVFYNIIKMIFPKIPRIIKKF